MQTLLPFNAGLVAEICIELSWKNHQEAYENLHDLPENQNKYLRNIIPLLHEKAGFENPANLLINWDL